MSDDNTRQTELADAFEARLDQARGGDGKILGELLDHYRDVLLSAAEREIQGKLKARIAPSDVVQLTLLSAIRNFAAFDGRSPAELQLWLDRIKDRNLLDLVRQHLKAGKRSVRNEQAQPENSSVIFGQADPNGTTPSELAVTNEDKQRLLRAIEHLPTDQQTAVRLRHLDGRPLADIMEHLGRTRESVAGLIKRGLANLRLHLNEDD